MGLYIVIGVVVLLVLWFIGAYNGFVKLKVSVEEAFSTMDVYMKKRYNLIPNLVATVKGYASHESETLEKVVQARNVASSAKTMDQKMEGESALTGTLKTLFAVAEAYPDLKANANFLDLQDQLKKIESEIVNSRKYYNAVVAEFNVKVRAFPSSIIAKIFKFKEQKMFEINNEIERENVKVEF